MDENPTLEKKSLSPVVAFAAASALGAILIVVLAHRFGMLTGDEMAHAGTGGKALVSPPARVPVTADQLVPVVPELPTHLPAADAALATMVAQGVAQLGVKPKTAVLPNEQALEEVAAIKRGDYAAASRLVQDVLAHSRIDGWHYVFFNRFMGNMTHGNDPALLDHLNEWTSPVSSNH